MEEKKTVCKCPYCDADIEFIEDMSPFCEPCSITIIICENCGAKAREGAERCP